MADQRLRPAGQRNQFPHRGGPPVQQLSQIEPVGFPQRRQRPPERLQRLILPFLPFLLFLLILLLLLLALRLRFLLSHAVSSRPGAVINTRPSCTSTMVFWQVP
jgi:hypothetical protein